MRSCTIDSGLAAYKNEQYEKAIEIFSEIIKKDNTNKIAYLNRGSAYFYTGELSLALTDFNKAIEIDNHFVSAYKNRANVYHEIGYQKIWGYAQAILDHRR